MRAADKIKEMERLRRALVKACSAGVLKDSVPVFGCGPVPCRIMVVGESPGRDETRLGVPFVGKAGKFLLEAINGALGLERQEIYITNVVKIWPTVKTKRLKTRKPLPWEEEFFLPYLMEEIRIVGPAVILAVGKTAFSALAPDKPFTPGSWTLGAGGMRIMPVYHPAYILRRQKRLVESARELKKALCLIKKEFL